MFKAHSKPNAWDAHNPKRIRGDLRQKGLDTGDSEGGYTWYYSDEAGTMYVFWYRS